MPDETLLNVTPRLDPTRVAEENEEHFKILKSTSLYTGTLEICEACGEDIIDVGFIDVDEKAYHPFCFVGVNHTKIRWLLNLTTTVLREVAGHDPLEAPVMAKFTLNACAEQIEALEFELAQLRALAATQEPAKVATATDELNEQPAVGKVSVPPITPPAIVDNLDVSAFSELTLMSIHCGFDGFGIDSDAIEPLLSAVKEELKLRDLTDAEGKLTNHGQNVKADLIDELTTYADSQAVLPEALLQIQADEPSFIPPHTYAAVAKISTTALLPMAWFMVMGPGSESEYDAAVQRMLLQELMRRTVLLNPTFHKSINIAALSEETLDSYATMFELEEDEPSFEESFVFATLGHDRFKERQQLAKPSRTGWTDKQLIEYFNSVPNHPASELTTNVMLAVMYDRGLIATTVTAEGEILVLADKGKQRVGQ